MSWNYLVDLKCCHLLSKSIGKEKRDWLLFLGIKTTWGLIAMIIELYNNNLKDLLNKKGFVYEPFEEKREIWENRMKLVYETQTANFRFSLSRAMFKIGAGLKDIVRKKWHSMYHVFVLVLLVTNMLLKNWSE